jgi:V/A-type H+-transporting ATPase subunit E
MPENLKGLLEKIHQEGIKSAEEKGRAIETQAQRGAEKIIEDARKEASRIIEDARSSAEKMKLAGEVALKHAGRDIILSVKKELGKMLDKIARVDISKALTGDELVRILGGMIEAYAAKEGMASDIRVLVKKDDLEKLKHSFAAKLKDKIKDGIELKPSSHIKAGFAISFDQGKSFYDFSEESIVQALRIFLDEELAKLLT